MADSEIREKLKQSVIGLEDTVKAFGRVSDMLVVFDRPSFPLCVGYVDDNNWLWVNNTFANLLGYTKDEMYSNPWTHFIVDSEVTKNIDNYGDRSSHGDVFSRYPVTHKCKDGSELTLIWDTSDVEGGKTFAVALIQNV
jgi:PAS domain S-box-containing protein